MIDVTIFNPVAIGKTRIDDDIFNKLNNISLELLSSRSTAEDYPGNNHLTLRGGDQRRMWPGESWIKNWIESQAKMYQKQLWEQSGKFGSLDLVPTLINAWTITQPENSYQVAHAHPFGHISGNIYLELPTFDSNSAETDGCISFVFDQHADARAVRFLHVKPELGMMLIFPSWLPHQVYPWQGKGNRRVIAWDCQLLPQ
jgi:uncharacterized protein (TIGR02466 family)